MPCDNWPDICGTKYYDANVNGKRDNHETGIAGWRITLINSAGLRIVTQTDAQGNYCIDHVPPDTYRVVEGTPVESSWHHSTPDSVNLDLRDPSFLETTVQVVFGNFCLGAGGGHTHGFWSNKNVAAQVMDRDSDPADQKEMSLLSRIALRETDGTHFDPPLYKTFRAWLRTGNAVNMARMLSVQLAAMELNVEAGFVNPDRLVYAPGCGKTGLNNDFITIGDLMDAADRALERNGLTPSGSADRQRQSCLMTALDNANNNLNFVGPC